MIEETVIIKQLLSIDHQTYARKAGFIDKQNIELTYDLLLEALGLLDRLSRTDDELSHRKIILITSLVWTYKRNEWTGLRDFLTPILTRSGFAPTSIMLDDEYEKDTRKFSHCNSIFSEFDIILNQLKYEITVGPKTYLLTDFQKKIWEKLADTRLLGISAPTSAGKSYIILLKAIDLLLEKSGNIIYIVPTLSLVSQVSIDFGKILKEFGLDNYSICNSYEENEEKSACIYVLTQEKAIAAFERSDEPFSNIRLLVVDEIQNLEKVSNDDDQRSKILYDAIIDFRHSCKADFTIIAGPRIESLQVLGVEVFGETESAEIETKDSPVFSLTYSISKLNGKYYFNQYCELLKHPQRLLIQNDSIIMGYGTRNYTDDYYNYFCSFVKSIADKQISIIFSPTSNKAEDIALEFISGNDDLSTKKINELAKYIKETTHDDYTLSKLVLRGVAFHHGKLPMNIRLVIERAIKESIIKTIVCTTTLMQGVNLPAQNLFMRSPDLALRKRDGNEIPVLTNYEIANLRGRAGRLMNDLIGRTFIMDESSFKKEEFQKELFESVEKTIETGYGKRFKDNEKQIKSNINSDKKLSKFDDTTSLSIYIRQTILKYGIQAKNRFNSVGIDISDEEITNIQNILSSLSVPKGICFKNRYWDPFVLNQIYLDRDKYIIPTSFYDSSFENRMCDLLFSIHNNYPNYFSRYVKCKFEKKSIALHLSILIKNWISEKTLKEILSDPFYDEQKKISNCINELQSVIAYGVSMLLKPFYDINATDNSILSFLEMGVSKPMTKKLIELNIPRETAIYLQRNYFNKKNDYTVDEIRSVLNQIKDSVNYWIKIQFEHLL